MNDEFNEIEKELIRYRPAEVSDELKRRIQVQMHRPPLRRWHWKDRIFAATVAAGILATCINVGLLTMGFQNGISEPGNQPVMALTIPTQRGFEPTELAWLQQQALLNESGISLPNQIMER